MAIKKHSNSGDFRLSVDHFLAGKWKNSDNAAFYEQLPVEKLQHYAAVIGLDSCVDLVLAQDYIDKDHSIIEIGACYGRVLTWLMNAGHQGELFGVERSQSLYALLARTFKERVTLYHSDLFSFQPNRTFDRVLWLWSGISDFAKSEHVPPMRHLCSWLTRDGLLIMDTFSHTLKPKNNEQVIFSNQSYVVEEEGCLAGGYTPSVSEIDTYLNELSLKLVKRIHYKTTTQRDRILHIIAKPSTPNRF